MFEIFTILIWFPIVFLASYILKIVLIRNNFGPFNTIINGLAFIGVVVHEFSHFIVSLLIGMRPRGIKIRYKDRRTGVTAPYGEVNYDPKTYSFLQTALTSLAPLYLSTWLFFFSLNIAFNSEIEPFYRVLAGFFCFSLFLGAAPSPQDFHLIGESFKYDLRHSMYQIFLVLLSGLMMLGILIYYEISLWYDFVYYLLVALGFIVLKYFFKGFKKLINSISGRKMRMDYSNIKK